jgi:hypothetical protein
VTVIEIPGVINARTDIPSSAAAAIAPFALPGWDRATVFGDGDLSNPDDTGYFRLNWAGSGVRGTFIWVDFNLSTVPHGYMFGGFNARSRLVEFLSGRGAYFLFYDGATLLDPGRNGGDLFDTLVGTDWVQGFAGGIMLDPPNLPGGSLSLFFFGGSSSTTFHADHSYITMRWLSPPPPPPPPHIVANRTTRARFLPVGS